MKTSFAIWLTVAFLVLGTVVLVNSWQYPARTGEPSPRSNMAGLPVPSLRLALLKPPGQLVDTSALLQHKVTVITTWASWCADCPARLSKLAQLGKKYKSRINFIGIAYKDTRDKALQWIQHTPNPFSTNLYDPDGQSAIEYVFYGVPSSMIIDEQGNIVGWFIDDSRVLDNYMRSHKMGREG